ncbi:MAG: PDC sensor domain-containing protein [Pseudomonadota bacterium]|nr:PDC sensor domain-containing protein [Pseudomonadota bacterium]MDP1903862.1 PDC sensor domain-containing protein [Pseudomonadota bacterium]MDP2353640.1 PDC sensor domain-containing protein [Pseudomonadota bacterium]
MTTPWKDGIYLQREQLALLLQEPLARLAAQCAPAWGDHERLNAVLLEGFFGIPHCTFLYCLGFDGIQLCDNIGADAGQPCLIPGHFGRDRSQRPYMNEAVPAWGFLLSDAYISLLKRRPSLTALQLVRDPNGTALGYLGADFDLRNLPATASLYEEPGHWRQIKGDPAIRSNVFLQCRVDSPMDMNLDKGLSILEELLTHRGVFQCQIHFSSSQATIWTVADPYRYRILDQDALGDPDICLVYPQQAYPADALIPEQDIARILANLSSLRLADENIYLRMSSINIFNGMVSLTFSCDGSHYLRFDEFLGSSSPFEFVSG